MAYRAFDAWPLGLDTAMPGDAAVAVRFTVLEARVIALADTDGPESVRARSGFGSFVDRLFGIKRSNSLADPKLETLRRFSVLARLADSRPPLREIERFVAAGFSPLQASSLQFRAAAARKFQR